MTKTRVLIFFTTIIIVFGLGYLLSLYARGYKFNTQTLRISPSGLLVIKSNPEAAQVYINGEFKTATNTSISLAPGTYDVSVKKDSYSNWNKRLTIEKEVVTEADAHLFKTAPSFSPVTISSCINPLSSDDSTKIAYSSPATRENISGQKDGLWVIENINLPLGFSRDPKRLTNGDLGDATWYWSPDGRQILLITKNGNFLLDATSYTSQDKRVNISNKIEATIAEWNDQRQKILNSKLKGLSEKLTDILLNNAANITFSLDETKILYRATSDAQIPSEIIKPIPGASTQKQERNIKKGQNYVYDIKEDRNFLVPGSDTTQIGYWPFDTLDKNPVPPQEKLIWFPTSRHLVYAKQGKIIILDYDGTNQQEVYSGSYVSPNVFTTLSTDRLLILTNLGADSSEANLYSLSLK
jgi:hypothetical protein